MRRFRRIILAAVFLTGAISVVLLLNFTASNPTGRRYSSRMPLTTGQGSAAQIGLAGELVLADDLRLPRNDAPDQLQCICNAQANVDSQNCRVCIASAPLSGAYRRPDFVAANFIAESKNAQNLYYDSRDLAQVNDFAMAAKALNRPLWVFTRVNTDLDAEFYQVVSSTGGGIVPYFTVPGYTDPIDRFAQIGFGLSLASMILIVVSRRNGQRQSFAGAPAPRQPADPFTQANRSVNHAENFVKDSKDRQKNKLD